MDFSCTFTSRKASKNFEYNDSKENVSPGITQITRLGYVWSMRYAITIDQKGVMSKTMSITIEIHEIAFVYIKKNEFNNLPNGNNVEGFVATDAAIL